MPTTYPNSHAGAATLRERYKVWADVVGAHNTAAEPVFELPEESDSEDSEVEDMDVMAGAAVAAAAVEEVVEDSSGPASY